LFSVERNSLCFQANAGPFRSIPTGAAAKEQASSSGFGSAPATPQKVHTHAHNTRTNPSWITQLSTKPNVHGPKRPDDLRGPNKVGNCVCVYELNAGAQETTKVKAIPMVRGALFFSLTLSSVKAKRLARQKLSVSALSVATRTERTFVRTVTEQFILNVLTQLTSDARW
jgi:hypothetical protein